MADLLLPLSNRKKVQQGKSPQCHKEPAAPGAWGVLKTTAIQAGAFDSRHNKALPTSMTPDPALEVEAGDLVMTCAGPRARCGVPSLVREVAPHILLSGKMYRFRANPDVISAKLLELLLLSPVIQDRIDGLKTGISESGLNLTQDRFLSMPIDIPALGDQRRLTEFIEAQLSHLEAAGAYLSSALTSNRQLSRVRAVNLLATDESVPLSSYVQRIEAGKSFGNSTRRADPDEWGIIKVSAMTWGTFDGNENKYVDAERVDRRYEIQDGDLLVSRANTSDYVGASVLVQAPRPRLLLSDKSLRLKLNSGVCAGWLQGVLSMPEVRRQISAFATGTKDSMRNISQNRLLSIEVPFVASGSDQRALYAQLTRIRQDEQETQSSLDVASRRATSLRYQIATSLLQPRTGTK
ncbi:hypothetical protein AB2L27_19750 [Kineococcus sp. LSe6-4]|uniref:Type I restriction modification DNA specificity domain-containing protein n=1 Tax=Kineococcus halophytocola TaxID=3234027 RepID=A0ABV4H5Y6_9ACTN